MLSPDSKILVTGGHGFIGGHVARRLCADGYKVRVTDINPQSYLDVPQNADFLLGNLCDPTFCMKALHGVDVVLHFAATMGGMGVIHSDNNLIIYEENHSMTLNLLSACLSHNVRGFFYASSACVYPDSLQGNGDVDVSLREDDVWAALPPCPQGLYGLEKLNTEQVLHSYASTLAIRVARFHNVYGPGGCWNGGREKAPAALLRKALAARAAGTFPFDLELWGDGFQRRSFCYIDDAVEGIIRLLRSGYTSAVNIGSDRAVSIQELAGIAVQCAKLSREQVHFRYDLNKPVGVGSRNSNNDFVQSLLQWTPQVTLEVGMARTAEWISGEMDHLLLGATKEEHQRLLVGMQTSETVDLHVRGRTFGILLPITSRGSVSPYACLNNLREFARSLLRTTIDDRSHLGQRFRLQVYLAIDHDDEFLLKPDGNEAETVLRDEGIFDVVTLACDFPRGHVCALWRRCALRAWQDGCDYFILLGDDVILEDSDWLSAVHDSFADFARREGVPEGFGCVALTDTTFPGMPTFPVVHRTHMDIFGGRVIPDSFINQDGDPFLFQLYRRWGCSRMIPSRIRNIMGGSGGARYCKVSAVDWTFQPLDSATSTVENWVGRYQPDVKRKLTLDVVIPCYRVLLPYLDAFLSLESSTTCTVMFIIIIDDPRSPNISQLDEYSGRPDVRIRINDVNRGASASRNRGMKESAAEWILFLDDDVKPEPNILYKAEEIIRAHPSAAGFVGNSQFPSADTIYTAAVHLAGVTYFWDIATKAGDMAMACDLPWGVTANLMVRRNVKDNVEFDVTFPKTGGGEDIDLCLRKRAYSIERGGGGFHAAPDVVVTHPWWNDGSRSYWRFYMWSKGDGALIKLYPDLTYRDIPNSAELLSLSALVILSGFSLWMSLLLLHGSASKSFLLLLGLRMCIAVLLSNILHDMYRHLWRDANRAAAIKTSIAGFAWIIAVIESSLIRIFSEFGRLVGLVERGQVELLGTRFDWFTNRAGDGPRNEERKNNLQRLTMSVLMMALLLAYV
ncbi:glycosyltransferase family 2 protein [Sparassis latifolia]